MDRWDQCSAGKSGMERDNNIRAFSPIIIHVNVLTSGIVHMYRVKCLYKEICMLMC